MAFPVDKIWAVVLGRKRNVYLVSEIEHPSRFDISAIMDEDESTFMRIHNYKDSANFLASATITHRTYQDDSLKNRAEYAKNFNCKKTKVKPKIKPGDTQPPTMLAYNDKLRANPIQLATVRFHIGQIADIFNKKKKRAIYSCNKICSSINSSAILKIVLPDHSSLNILEYSQIPHLVISCKNTPNIRTITSHI